MRLSFTSRAFSAGNLETIVREACSLPDSAPVPDQVRYLATYLENSELRAQTLLVERPYVDRHFLTEFQGYYATALREVPRHTTRVHAFTTKFTVEELISRLGTAEDEAGRAAIAAEVQDAYLGFVVLRPLPTAPVGRTVLRWYRKRDARCFGSLPPPHRVHILGLTLKAYGVQFHQQDRAVGACATAAVWCALAAVMRRDGGRSPTPLAVTEWANRSIPTSRAFPAVAGLTLEQMIGAINASGYSPDVIKPDGHPAVFQLQLMTYVRSGIPVILQLREEDAADGHAVTVVGFRVSDEELHVPPIEYPFKESYVLRAKGMTRIYVNDDRLGPYARMVWVDEMHKHAAKDDLDQLFLRVERLEAASDSSGKYEEEQLEDGMVEAPQSPDGTSPPRNSRAFPALTLLPNAKGFESFEKKLRVWTAIAPLYPKIRINALDLNSVAMEVWPVASFLAGRDRRDEVHLESFFALGGTYMASIYERGLPGHRAAEIASSLVLSRYVGVLRFVAGADWLLDVLCDATDIHRESAPWASVLAVIPAEPHRVGELQSIMSKQFSHVVAI